MTKTPPEPRDEELDELDEEAIVAQQSVAHSPQRRVQVKVESRSVVVADDDAEATRQLEVYTAGTADPTLVVRDKERRALVDAAAGPEVPRKKSWVPLAIWIGAGLLAFGLGAVLAVVRGSGPRSVAATPAPAASPTGVAPAPEPAARTAALDALPRQDAAPPRPSAAEPALELDQLPVERGKKKPVRAVRPAGRPSTNAKVQQPATPSPPKDAIPSGI